MAGAGIKNFGTEVLSSNDVDQYLMQQTTMVFATTSDRTTAFSTQGITPSTGMMSFITATKSLEIYDGTAWISIVATSGVPSLVKIIPTSATNGTVGSTGLVTIGSTVSSVTVNGAFSNLYTNYRIAVSGITPSASNSFRLMIGSSRTDAHYGVMNYNLSTGTGLDSIKTNNAASIYCVLTQGSVNNAMFTCDILSPSLSSRTIMIGQGFGRLYYCDFGGTDDSVAAYTSFTLLTDGGTMTGGSISVYGYQF
jgi:hypothetical protein